MTTRACKHQLLTLPNLLSLLRLAMIPLMVTLYLRGEVTSAALVIIASGLTDVLDGWIARRFNAVSDVGKVLDPVADKLTLAAALGMLASQHPSLIVPLVLLVIKEIIMTITGMMALFRTSQVPCAVWHGKATTALIYATMLAHIIWQEIPLSVSNIMAAACTALMLLSLTLYTLDNVRRIRSGRGGSNAV